MLSVDVEERGPSPTSRRRRAACPPTPAAAPALSVPPVEAGCRPSRSFVDRRLQSSGRTAVPATTAGTGHRQGPLDGHKRRADERPHSRSSKGSSWSACDARGTEFLDISMITTCTPQRALFGKLVLHIAAPDRTPLANTARRRAFLVVDLTSRNRCPVTGGLSPIWWVASPPATRPATPPNRAGPPPQSGWPAPQIGLAHPPNRAGPPRQTGWPEGWPGPKSG